MHTATFDFTGDRAVRRGSDYRLTIAFKQPDGRAVNLTGATVIAQFRKSLNQGVAYSLVVSITEPLTDGSVSLLIPAAITAPLPTGKYLWDMLFTMATGDKWRAIEGELHLVGGVS